MLKGSDRVTPLERDLAVLGLAETLEALGRGGDWDSLAFAASILDRVLHAAAVPPKYLHCLAAAALGLAIKMSEESEWVPEAGALSAASGGRLSQKELVRMERAILELLGWELRGPTIERFLHGLAGQAGLGPLFALSGKRWERLVRAVVADSAILAAERPSDLALALLSLHLQACAVPHWLHITSTLQVILSSPSPSTSCPHQRL